MSGILISKPGKRYKYNKLEFFAEKGLIHVFDFRKGAYNPDYNQLTVKDMLERAKALNSQAKRVQWPDEREKLIRFVEDIVKCCKEAKNQGNPHDPKVLDHVRAMRNKWILQPGKEPLKKEII